MVDVGFNPRTWRSELPVDRTARVRRIRAVPPRANRRREVLPERRMDLRHARHRRADRPSGVEAGALGVRGRLAVTAPQSDRPGQLADQELTLFAGTLGPLRVVEILGLVDLLLELV